MRKRRARRVSRLERVRRKRELRQALIYLSLSVVIVIGVFVWGIPAFARLAGMLIDDQKDSIPLEREEVVLTAPFLEDIPEATKSAQLKIKGLAEPGIEVKIFLNNLEKSSLVTDKEGNFATVIELQEGENWIYAQTYYQGKVGPRSKSYRVVLDQTPIEIEILEPEEGKEFHGEEERVVKIRGVLNKKVEEVKVGGRVAVLKGDNQFETEYSLSEGDNVIEIVARDKAGNEAMTELRLSWYP